MAQQLNATFAELHRLTEAMLEALGRQDLEGFSGLIDQRGAVIAAIGERRPNGPEEEQHLRETTRLSAEINALVASVQEGLLKDFEQVLRGQQGAAAYLRTMAGWPGQSSSKFIDRAK